MYVFATVSPAIADNESVRLSGAVQEEKGDLGLCSQPVKYTARHSKPGGIVIIFV